MLSGDGSISQSTAGAVYEVKHRPAELSQWTDVELAAHFTPLIGCDITDI